jgi:hypothetical protein
MDLNLDTFKPLLHGTFVLPFQDIDDWELTLSEVNEMPDIPGQSRKRFSLVFHSANSEQYLQQATYLLKHEKIGDNHFFLVSLGPGPDGGFLYESVFT